MGKFIFGLSLGVLLIGILDDLFPNHGHLINPAASNSMRVTSKSHWCGIIGNTVIPARYWSARIDTDGKIRCHVEDAPEIAKE